MTTYFLRAVLLLTVLMGAEVATGHAGECPVAEERLLHLSPDAFDQDVNGGWHTLADHAGCEKAAADLIRRYIAQNWGRIAQGDLHVMYWHAGQLEALAGDYLQAVPLLMAGVSPDRGRDIGFHEYALGTIAFLHRDLAGLKAARQRLSALPQPAALKAEFGDHWPPNLRVLDGLIRCFGSSYAVAYGNDCPREQVAQR